MADELFIRAQMPGLDVKVLREEAGHTEIVWTKNGDYVGVFKLDFTDRAIHCSSLHIIAEHQGTGVMTRLTETMLPLWTEEGYERLTMSPGTAESQRRLEAVGFHQLDEKDFGILLAAKI